MPFLSIVMLIPAAALCVFIYLKDRVEKEPWWLLLLLFCLGAALFFPVLYAERALTGLFDKAFSGDIQFTLSGVAEYGSKGVKALHNSLCAFVGVALIEEIVKWFAVQAVTYRSKDFNCLFDGIVYHVFYAAGFAAADSVRFAIKNGTGMLLMRSLAVVPAYLLFGVVSGLLYTLIHTRGEAANFEDAMIAREEYKKKLIRLNGLLVPAAILICTAIHGLFALTSMDGASADLRFAYFVMTVLLWAAGFLIVSMVSKRDAFSLTVAEAWARRVHDRAGEPTPIHVEEEAEPAPEENAEPAPEEEGGEEE